MSQGGIDGAGRVQLQTLWGGKKKKKNSRRRNDSAEDSDVAKGRDLARDVSTLYVYVKKKTAAIESSL